MALRRRTRSAQWLLWKKNKDLRLETRQAVAMKLADVYAELYESIDAEIAAEVFPHAPSEVRSLLG